MPGLRFNTILYGSFFLLLLSAVGVLFYLDNQQQAATDKLARLEHENAIIRTATQAELVAHEYVLTYRDLLREKDSLSLVKLQLITTSLIELGNKLHSEEAEKHVSHTDAESLRKNILELTLLQEKITGFNPEQSGPGSILSPQAKELIRQELQKKLAETQELSQVLKKQETLLSEARLQHAGKSLKRLTSLFYIVFGGMLLVAALVMLRLRKEYRLRADREIQFVKLLESTPDATIITNEKGNLLLANKQAELLFGYTKAELLKMTVEELLPHAFREIHKEQREKYNTHQHCRPMAGIGSEFKALHKSGNIIPVEISLSPIQDVSGNLVVAALRDISERIQVNEQIRQLYTQINKAGEAIYVTDHERVIRNWNKGAELLYGFDEAEAIGKTAVTLLHTTMRDEEREKARVEMESNDYWTGDILRYKKDGSPVYVHSSLSAIRDITGAITGYVSVSFDITEEQRLREERTYLANITEQMSEAVLSHRTDSPVLITWNKGAERLLGFTAAEAVGNTIQELGIIQLTPAEAEWLDSELRKTGVWRLEKELKRKNGSVFTGAITATSLKDEKGDVYSFVYLIKDVTAEKMLGEAIRKYNEELEEQVESRTHEIRENELQYRYLFENNPMPMWVFDVADLKFLDVNEMAIQKYGYSREEFLQLSLADIRPEAEKMRFRNFDHAWQMKSGETNRGVWKHCKKNGEIIDVEVFAHAIFFQGRKAKLILLNDVTHRLETERQLQSSEKKFRALIENSTDLIALVDQESKMIYRSPAAARITGWSDDEMKGVVFIDAIVHPDDQSVISDRFRYVLENPGTPVVVNYRSRHRDGHYVQLEGVWINLLHRSYVKAVVFNMRDVTVQKEAELKLQASEKRFRSLIENSFDIIILLDEQCRIIYRSPSAERITGRTNEETIGVDPRTSIHSEDLTAINKGFDRLLHNPGSSEYALFRHLTKNNEYRWMEGYATNLLDDPDVKAIVFNYRDVSDRINHETKLRESEERYRLTLDNMLEGVQIIGFDGRYKYVNKAVADQVHTTVDALSGALMTEKFPGIEHTHVYALIKKCLSDRMPFQLENEFVLSDGEIIWTQLSIQPVPEGVFILSVDITEKIKAAAALREEEEKLSSVAASSPGLIFSFRMGADHQLSFPYLSSVSREVMGYDADEVNADVYGLMRSTFYEADQELYLNSLAESARNLKPWKLEFRYHHPVKGLIWLEGSSVPKKEPDGSIIWHGVIMDVTERKEIQQKINEQAAQLQTLSDNLPGVMIFQLTGTSFEDRHFSYVSNEVVQLCGHPAADVIQNPGLLYGLILEEDRPRLIQAELEAYKQFSIFNEEVRVRDLAGNIRWVNIVSTLRKTEDGQLVWDGFCLDITDRKTAENAIRASEERYRTLVEQAFDGILYYDATGNILDCNLSGAQTLGYEVEEMKQLHVSTLFFEEDLKIRPLNIPDVQAGKQLFDYRTMRRKDGSSVEIEWVTRQLPDGRFLAVGRDITHQNQALSQQILLSSIVNTSDDAIISTDTDGLITSWNRGAEHIYGYTADEMLGRDTIILIPPDILHAEKATLERINNGEYMQHYETTRLRKDGVRILVSITATPLINSKGILTGVSKVVRDITQQKGAELRIRESNERYEAVAKATSDAIWDFDYSTMKTFIAGTGYKYLFGYPLINQYSPAEFWEERLHPADKAYVLAKMNEVKKDPVIRQSNVEYRFRKADGTYAYVNDRFFIIRDETGRPVRLLGAKQDITRQKEDEEHLRRNAAEKQLLYDRLSVILNTLPASVALLDTHGVVVEVNEAWKTLADNTGFSDDRYGIGNSYLTVSTRSFGDREEDGIRIAEGIQSVLDGISPQFAHEYEWHVGREKHWFRIVVIPLQGIEFNGAVVMHMDISEIRRLEQERIDSKIEEQKRITEAMLKGQEKERNAIGIELHDNVNQILVGTKVLLSVVREYPEKTDELIPNCIENISMAIQENRKIAHELVTPNLNNESLKQQIDRLAATMLKNAGINTYINHESLNEGLLTNDMKLTLYRVAQEQCTNIIKYAQAEQVIISMATKNDYLIMRIADDGVGMDQQQLTHGIGLKNMSSRLGVLGGTINIDTAPGQGFALEIELPLVQEKTSS